MDSGRAPDPDDGPRVPAGQARTPDGGGATSAESPAPRVPPWRWAALAAVLLIVVGGALALGARRSAPGSGVLQWLGMGSVCGNGRAEAGEECDDGNGRADDRCL